MAFSISSTAFRLGKSIPEIHTCDGDDTSPFLHWSDTPKSAVTLAMIMEDPDAPNGTFTHWIIYNMPPNLTELERIIPIKNNLDNGAVQARNSFGKIGYGGPCPPEGEEHRYYFKLYALDKKFAPNSINDADTFYDAIKDAVIDEAVYMGTYRKKNT
jgi:Raf kinase inhibitor-like YbhB/YbcL family protein